MYKLKLLIVGAILIVSFHKLSANTADDNSGRLFWADTVRLTFLDFKGKPDDTSKYGFDEYGLAKLRTALVLKRATKGKTTLFTIHASMDMKNSWIKSAKDIVSLRHEQGHFDICEVYARILRKEILKATSINDARKIYDHIS